jgi:fructokinase
MMVGLGEATHGAGKDKYIVAYITVSTGIGGCRIENEHITANAMGFEPGHQIIDIDGSVCGCNGNGHLEGIVSGAAFQRIHGKPAKDIEDPAIWEKAARDLATGLHNVLVFWSPDCIILGGSLMKRLPLDLVREHLIRITTVFRKPPPIRLSALEDTGGLIGSLVYLKKQA